MRQGQQNRRGRGRSNNNNNSGRKGQNPLTRNYESNGPDVKIKGTPAHVAEKYMTYARDALSSGDPVLAENFLQHAEHYNRIILTYREQQIQQSNDNSNGSSNGRPRTNPNMAPGENTAAAEGQPADASSSGPRPGAPQPDIDEAPPQRSRDSRRNDGQRSSRGRSNGSSGRSGNSRSDGTRQNGASDGERGSDARRPPDRFGDSDEQPQFLRRPVRRSSTSDAEQPESAGAKPEVAAEAAPTSDDSQD